MLGGGLVLGLTAALGGCTDAPPAAPPRPHPDVAVLLAATVAERELLALYAAVRSAHEDLAARLDPIIERHRRHLDVLHRHRLHPVTRSAAPSPTAPLAPAAPDRPAKALSVLRAAELRAAAARLDDVAAVAPGLAQLLAAIGACEAAHAESLAAA